MIAVHAGLHPEWEEAHLETLEGGDVDYAVKRALLRRARGAAAARLAAAGSAVSTVG